ncbi:ribonuclease E/G [Halobacillus sp. A5]|uniref:ribonuclease E/G n=1 Tax=Halobacillus sp. A5 TaxID=2880263 RepID=UPI0020A65E6C|nr:ribonuclease E/G [Halobacillus sp. A5]MCP3025543.1 ribonuclease E/G [Halobacillus sp. A5]
MRTLAVHTRTSEKVGLVIDHGRVTEYTAARPEAPLLSGSIYKGIVQSIHKGLQAAFVDIGEGKNAFLRKDSIPWCKESIEQTITEGQYLYAQVIKEPTGNKGAQLSLDLTIPGFSVIYQPFGSRISVSKKIDKQLGIQLKYDIEGVLEKGEGAILRTTASQTNAEEVAQELTMLKKEWSSCMKSDKPGLIWSDEVILNQFIRKHGAECDLVLVDSAEVSQTLKRRYPSLLNKIQWRKNLENDTHQLVNELQDQLIKRTVTTNKGVQLIFDSTEAMTVIDVNSHQYMDKSFSSAEALKINKHAAVEIARQVRLRNYSGMILIDFISMKRNDHNEKLIDWLRKETSRDSVYTKVHGVTKLGLMEVTRTRQLPSVNEQMLRFIEQEYNIPSHWYRLERYLMNNDQHEAVLLKVNTDLYDWKKQLRLEPVSSKIPQELFVKRDEHITGWQIELEGSLDIVKDAAENRGHAVDNLF